MINNNEEIWNETHNNIYLYIIFYDITINNNISQIFFQKTKKLTVQTSPNFPPKFFCSCLPISMSLTIKYPCLNFDIFWKWFDAFFFWIFNNLDIGHFWGIWDWGKKGDRRRFEVGKC
jgi:hypothetical protein